MPARTKAGQMPKSGSYDASPARGWKTAKSARYDASVEIGRKAFRTTCPGVALAKPDGSAVQAPPAPGKSENDRPCRSLTIRAWLFGHKLRCQSGQTPKNLTTPVRPKVRWQLNPQQLLPVAPILFDRVCKFVPSPYISIR